MNEHNPAALTTPEQLLALIERLYPICRSITGNGVRETLRVLENHLPLVIHEVPTGTPVFDWTVPREWNIKDAYVKNSRGEKILDFNDCNLHVLNYSVPVKKTVTLEELKAHAFSLPDRPDWIPYRTSYYKDNWGFCFAHNQLEALEDGRYEVCIDSTLEPGSLTYGEYFLAGETEDEILISAHVCHPSLANDNLSSIAMSVSLAQMLRARPSRRYSYRFVYAPGSIGAITWLSLNEARAPRIKHGLVLACVGDSGSIHYKKSRRGGTEIDRAVAKVLADSGEPYSLIDFSPYGYDERQYCSPGFNLAVGCFMRTPHGEFPEYHTSGDNLNLVRPEGLSDSRAKLVRIIDVLESNRAYLNLNPKCEPQLGKRGLYASIGGTSGRLKELAMLWTLNMSDGEHTLLDIAEKSGLAYSMIQESADALRKQDLLRPVSG